MSRARRAVLWALLSAAAVPSPASAAAPSGSWTSEVSLPAHRNGASLVRVGSLLYYIGGNVNAREFATVRAYDPASGTWTFKRAMPTARNGFYAAAVSTAIYVAGGWTGLTRTNALEVYDTVADSWTTKTAMPAAMDTGAVAVYNGKLYALTGAVAGFCAADAYAYDVASDSWTTLTSAPTTRCHARAAVYGGLIYVVGGSNTGGTPFATVEAYDPVGNSWSTKAGLQTARYLGGVAVSSASIYAVAGTTGNGVGLSTVEVYDPVGNSWSYKASAPKARVAFAMETGADGRFYAVGGVDSSASYQDILEIDAYDPASDAWTVKAALVPGPRRDAAAVAVSSASLFVVGGQDGEGPTDLLQHYDATWARWDRSPSALAMLPSRSTSPVAALLNGTLYAAGGMQTSTVPSSGLWSYDAAAGTWTARASMPTAGGCGAAGVINGKLYVLVSCDGTAGGTAALAAYDPATNAWTAKAAAPNVHRSPAFGVIGGKLYVAGGTSGAGAASAVLDVYDPATNAWTTKRAMTTARTGPAGGTVAGAYLAVAGGDDGAGTKLSSVEIYDAAGDSWSSGPALPTARSGAAAAAAGARLFAFGGAAASGDTDVVEALTVALTTQPAVSSVSPSRAAPTVAAGLTLTGSAFEAGSTLSAERPDVRSASWTTVGSMTAARNQGQSVVLRDGRVLVVGGYTGGVTSLTNADIFDPASGNWVSVASMSASRYIAAVALLPDGRVLAAGGRQNVNNASAVDISSSEIYDPAADTWSATASMPQVLDGPLTYVRPDGKVLAVGGGFANGTHTAATALYDPAAGTWSAGPSMSVPRISAAGVTLADGRFFVAGGVANGPTLASAEIYDPASSTWTAAASMTTARYAHTMALLPDGRVLVAGGSTASSGTVSVEIYDPTANAWTSGPSMTQPHSSGVAFVVGGKVVVAGGSAAPSATAAAEVYDPQTSTWTAGPSMSTGRVFHGVVPLADGRVLAYGGATNGYPTAALASAEVFSAPWTAVAAAGVTVPDAQHVSGTLTLPAGTTGYWDLVVRGPAGRVGRLPGGLYVPPVLTSLSAVPASAVLVTGSSRTFSVLGGFSDGSSSLVAASWSSDSPGGVSVTAGGTATAVSAGTAHLTASSGSIVAVATVTVTDPWPTLASVTPSSAPAGGLAPLSFGGARLDATASFALEKADVAASSWTRIAPLTVARNQSQTVALRDGRVLVLGGFTGDVTSLASAEIFDPATGAWVAAATMSASRYIAAVAVLPDGRVLAAGGRQNVANASPVDIASSEVYDPATDAWSPTGPMPQVLDGPLTFVRPDGKVLAIGGGFANGVHTAATALYDPAVGTWSAGPSMSVPRISAAGVTLRDGRFLVAGGTANGPTLASAEIYDPTANAWSNAASMAVTRYALTLTLLPDGRVLAAGGSTASSAVSSAEVYDPVRDAWITVASMPSAHSSAAAGLLGGKVFIAGGNDTSGTISRTESFDPGTLSWSTGPALAYPDLFGTLVPLGDGRQILVGGAGGGYPTPSTTSVQVLGASWTPILMTGVSVPDAAHASGSVDLTSAAPGYYDVALRQSGGRKDRLSGAFTVRSNPGTPVLTGSALGVSSMSWTWGALAGQSGYRVLTSTGGDRSGLISTATTNWTETGLSPNAATTRRLLAFDAVGSSATSAARTVYTRANAPTGSAASAVYYSSATLSWGLNGNPAGTTAAVERSSDAATFSALYSSGVTSYTDAGLVSCTTYYYRVRDLNGDGLASAYDATVAVLTKTAPPAPPSGLTATALSGAAIALAWDASPSTRTITAYRLYMSTGVLDYLTPYAVLPATATSYTTPALSTGTSYRFGLRAYDASCSGSDDGNTGVVATASPLSDPSQVRAAIKVPESGKKVTGNRLTVMAELVSGDASRVHAVRFQYRTAASTTAAWTDIPAVDSAHPNPDLVAPYFIHWDVTALANGPYELRAVAVDADLLADPAPPSIVITVDSVSHDVDETVVGGSQRKAETVYAGSRRTVGTADAASGAVVEVVLPAGAVSASSDTLTVQVNPSGAPPPAAGQHAVGQSLQVTLGSGQTSLGSTASIVMHYADADGDGVVDGTAYRVADLQIFSYDAASGKWRKESASVIDKAAKTVTATTPHFSLFGLFAAAAADLSGVLVYPVPWVPNDGIDDNGKPYSASDATSGVVFDGLTAAVRVQVYSASGSLVWQYSTASSGGRVQWDGRGLSGRDAASGGYIAVITDTATNARAVRKIAIIR